MHRLFWELAGRHGHDGGGWRGFGDRFGGGFGGGPRGMRPSKMLSSSELQLVILALVSERPRHGYEIIKALEEHSSGVYAPSPGMVYPALTYLEEAGYTTATADGARKLYQLSDEGRAHLAQRRAQADAALDELRRYGRRMSQAHELYEEEARSDEWAEARGAEKRQARAEWRQVKAEFHELRAELKEALWEKLTAPLEEKQRVLEVIRRAIAEIRRGS